MIKSYKKRRFIADREEDIENRTKVAIDLLDAEPVKGGVTQ